MDRDTSTDGPITPREEEEREKTEAGHPDAVAPNPPRTHTGPIAAPKFGSAGSGGAELEPGPERD